MATRSTCALTLLCIVHQYSTVPYTCRDTLYQNIKFILYDYISIGLYCIFERQQGEYCEFHVSRAHKALAMQRPELNMRCILFRITIPLFLIKNCNFEHICTCSAGGSRAPACKQKVPRRQGGENYSVQIDGERYSTEQSPQVFTYVFPFFSYISYLH